MLSLIDVQCPHCGAQGQIMLPPMGSIIIGPCPQCKELVVVFCGQVLALDKQIMENADIRERRDHLHAVLSEFLHERISKLMTDEKGGGTASDSGESATGESEADESPALEQPVAESEPAITEGEFERFLDVDLKLLDNKAYFRSVFGGK